MDWNGLTDAFIRIGGEFHWPVMALGALTYLVASPDGFDEQRLLSSQVVMTDVAKDLRSGE